MKFLKKQKTAKHGKSHVLFFASVALGTNYNKEFYMKYQCDSSYELLDSGRGAEHRVGYQKLISNKLISKHWIKISRILFSTDSSFSVSFNREKFPR